MTKQAKEVLDNCDFSYTENNLRIAENLVVKHTVHQITSLIWRKDKSGSQSLDWFYPFFSTGYVPVIIRDVQVIFDDAFWKTYFLINNFVEPFDIKYMHLINEMSEDILRVKKAMQSSKPNILYLYKVWTSTKVDVVQTNEVLEIKKHEVRTTEFT